MAHIISIFKIDIKRMYGGDLSALEEAIKLGMVSDQLSSFRQKQVVIFDLETLEKDIALNTNIEVEGVLKLVSIGCASTLSTESRYFERKSSFPEHSTELDISLLIYY